LKRSYDKAPVIAYDLASDSEIQSVIPPQCQFKRVYQKQLRESRETSPELVTDRNLNVNYGSP
jgi:hypothetical protein